MKQILQSYKTGELWLAEVPVPACKSLGVVVQTQNSFVSAGTERINSHKKSWSDILLDVLDNESIEHQ